MNTQEAKLKCGWHTCQDTRAGESRYCAHHAKLAAKEREALEKLKAAAK